MSKEKVLEFFTEAAKEESLQKELQTVSDRQELVQLGQQKGYEFSPQHVEEAIADLQQQPGFFNLLAQAVLAIFGPSNDDYPTTGVQPFSGEVSRRRR
ncbi:MAG: Nif11-like leader peptide family natural product precursor [Cyanophyceae cyanobacterium]